MFKKLVAIEPVSLIPTAEEALHQYAEQVELYRDIPADDEEIVRRIGDADAALLSYTSRMGKNVIERCPNLRYIGMCCSLMRSGFCGAPRNWRASEHWRNPCETCCFCRRSRTAADRSRAFVRQSERSAQQWTKPKKPRHRLRFWRILPRRWRHRRRLNEA